MLISVFQKYLLFYLAAPNIDAHGIFLVSRNEVILKLIYLLNRRHTFSEGIVLDLIYLHILPPIFPADLGIGIDPFLLFLFPYKKKKKLH